jgi:hypothetical protein
MYIIASCECTLQARRYSKIVGRGLESRQVDRDSPLAYVGLNIQISYVGQQQELHQLLIVSRDPVVIASGNQSFQGYALDHMIQVLA